MVNSDVLFRGSGLMLNYDGFYVYGIKRIEESANEKKLILTGIGGKVEKGENYLQSALRESMEEIHITPEIALSKETLLIDGDGSKVQENVSEGPLLIVNRIAHGYSDRLTVYVFDAAIHSMPVINDDEFNFLLLLNKACLFEILEKQPTLDILLSKGAKMVNKIPYDNLLDYKIGFTDSPEAYIKYLPWILSHSKFI